MKRPFRTRHLAHLAMNSLILGWLSGCIGAGDNTAIEQLEADRFPTITGISLLGDQVTLPDGFEGEVILVSMGFVRGHQNDIDTWIAALPEIQKEASALRFYEVPVIYEAGPLFRWWLNNGMRIGVVEEAARRRTITVYTDRDQFQDAVGLPGIEEIQTLLLDSDHRIVERWTGRLDDETRNSVVRLANELAAR
ncbi:MAG: hypothetical protein AAGC99_09130 [Pseudomonadota bacterium]